jgi:L-aminopeptidase/D-esterase-like protein
MRNLITDVPGLRVGHADDACLGSGVTALVFEAPAIASIAVSGGAPGLRDTALLEPGMTVERVDAFVLSGGSAFGLDAPGGVQAVLRAAGRGFRVGDLNVPIVPGAILFDLANGGDKAWGDTPIYWQLGREAALAVGDTFALGSVGAGLGATTATLKGGIGSASAIASNGFRVGALVAVNAIGSATVGDGPHFWASPVEVGMEFGGLGWPTQMSAVDLVPQLKGRAPANTTIGIVVTDAALTKSQAKHLAIMAQDGLARALRPAHAPLDGDTVFAAATAGAPGTIEPYDLTLIGLCAADCLARAIARGIYEARALPFPGAKPAWRDRFGS